MSSVNIQVATINKRLLEIASRVSLQDRRKVYSKAGRKVIKAAKQNVNVKSGKLKKSIGQLPIARRSDAIFVGVKKKKGSKRGDSPYYAHMVEYGTVKQKPQAYMRRAYETTKDQVRDEVVTGLTKEYQKAINHVSKR